VSHITVLSTRSIAGTGLVPREVHAIVKVRISSGPHTLGRERPAGITLPVHPRYNSDWNY